jgi:hypothetical protein
LQISNKPSNEKMELKIKTEAKIGFIVLATIILVIWGINFLKGKKCA